MFSFYLLCAITLLVCLFQIISFRRLLNYVQNELRQPRPDYLPRLTVILPCKGLDPGFRDNIVKLLGQDYRDPESGRANFEVIFTVATKEDPAYPVLKEISSANQDLVSSKVIVAGINNVRAQKLNNQLEALKHMSAETEVIAFVDSDVIARPDFLRHLSARLSDPKVGATTGYRFYIPYRGDSASLVRSLWNRMSAWEMASPAYAFAWGGAMAIRQETFVRAKVQAHWDKAADDDLSLTTAVKALGLEVRFIPQCLVASHGDASVAEIIEWTNRQLILTKVYYPKLWRRAIFRAALMAVWLVAVLSQLGAFCLSGAPQALNGLLAGLLLLPIELVFLLLAQSLWQNVLKDTKSELAESFWRFCLALPLAHLTLPWMTLYSICTNRIQWRGVTYELRSPTETVVVRA